MAKAYAGQILVIDLTAGTVQEEKLEERLYRQFIGAEGLGTRLLYQRQPAKVDALGEQNILGFMPGLLSGTGVPCSSRLSLVSKSPLTGGWGAASVGGHMPRELKRAGYDGILFQGISPSPVYLLIYRGKAELRDASHLWGKDTTETVESLCQEVGDNSLAVGCIGPAGESMSLISSVIFDKSRAAGRSGLGAVMGSKRLKAVAVKGENRVPVANADSLRVLSRGFIERTKESPPAKGWRAKGTPGGLENFVNIGATPIKNWTLAGIDALPFVANINGDSVNSHLVENSRGRASCADCPIACGAFIELEIDGVTKEVHRPEYETIAGFGALCFNGDLTSIVKANEMCNRYGIDTISASSTIAFATECYERGIITKKDTDGVELTWNNAAASLAILKKMATREGVGVILADGVKRAADRIGHDAEECAIHVGGQEIGYHDPRLLPARGAGYICDSTPGRHTSALAACAAESGVSLGSYPEFQLPKVDRHDYGNKSSIYGIACKYQQVFVSSGLCLFAVYVGVPLVDIIVAVTGWDFSPKELLATGERILTLRQLFNIREGIKPSEANLPDRLSQTPVVGPLKGIAVDFDLLRKQYYEAAGWDPETGYPLQSRLAELNLADVESTRLA